MCKLYEFLLEGGGNKDHKDHEASEELEDTDPDVCPECGSEIKNLCSGVKCSNPECSWWFCY